MNDLYYPVQLNEDNKKYFLDKKDSKGTHVTKTNFENKTYFFFFDDELKAHVKIIFLGILIGIYIKFSDS